MSQRKLMPPQGHGHHLVVCCPSFQTCARSHKTNKHPVFFCWRLYTECWLLFSRDLENLRILNATKLCHWRLSKKYDNKQRCENSQNLGPLSHSNLMASQRRHPFFTQTFKCVKKNTEHVIKVLQKEHFSASLVDADYWRKHPPSSVQWVSFCWQDSTCDRLWLGGMNFFVFWLSTDFGLWCWKKNHVQLKVNIFNNCVKKSRKWVSFFCVCWIKSTGRSCVVLSKSFPKIPEWKCDSDCP